MSEAGPGARSSAIVPLERAKLRAAATALAGAFVDDPWQRHLHPDDATRFGRLERGFELYLDRFWMGRFTCLTTEEVAGAAIWGEPGRHRPPLSALAAVLPGFVRYARGDAPRLLDFAARMERAHPRGRSYWYLQVVGVGPGFQGRGYGSALMRPILERCDAEGVPAYLEASSPRNRALYERHGFEVTGELAPRGGPTGWLMWREPRR